MVETTFNQQKRVKSELLSDLQSKFCCANQQGAPLFSKKNETMSLCVCIDFGGVLSVHDKSDDSGHMSINIDMKEAVDTLKSLKKAGHRLHLNSFCGKARADLTRKALNEKTADLLTSLNFVKDKKYKGLITKMTGADVMIDDRLDVLLLVKKRDPECKHLILFAGDPSFTKPEKVPDGIVMLDSWTSVAKYLETVKPAKREPDTTDISTRMYM